MWRELLSRMGIKPHPSLVRRVKHNMPIHGLFCGGEGAGVLEGTLLCSIPCRACLAPNTARDSGGTALPVVTTIASYSLCDNGARVEYAKESATTTALCAFHLSHGTGALREYLEWIVIEKADDGELWDALGPGGLAKLRAIEKLNMKIMEQMCEDARGGGVSIAFETMKRAHDICSSRCVDVPSPVDLLGGPALVPFVDLINHSDEEPNVGVSVVHHPPSQPPDQWSIDRCFVDVRAERDISPGEELHYQYVQADDECARNPLYWAARFNMCK